MFSEKEKLILKILGRKRMTIGDISLKFYTRVPLNGEIIIGNSIRRIIAKCEHHELPWTLEKIRKDKRLVIRRVTLQN